MAKSTPKMPEYSVEEQRAITQNQLAKPGEAPGRPQDPMYQQRESTMLRRLAHTGTQPATLVNFLPTRLGVNSAMPDLQRKIPACTLNDEFVAYCWNKPIIEAIMSEGVRTPIDYVPRQMAEEFLREYTMEGGPGGVMIFDGTIEEFLVAKEREPQVQEAVELTKQQAIVWMMAKYQEAQNAWNTPNHQMSANITQIHRDCAARLKKLEQLGDHDPEWMDLKPTQASISTICPICRLQARPGQLVCTNCTYTFDVAGAFRAKLINEESLLLERLTRDQVEELGVSAYVAETSDEAPARMKKGLPRPLSVAQQAMQNDFAEQQRAAAKAAN
jgi:hypothetical protein